MQTIGDAAAVVVERLRQRVEDKRGGRGHEPAPAASGRDKGRGTPSAGGESSAMVAGEIHHTASPEKAEP